MDNRLTIPAGAVLPRAIIIEIKSILTFDNVMIISAVDAETGFCYTKLIGNSGETGTFIDAPLEMITAGDSASAPILTQESVEMESVPGAVATGSVISGLNPVAPGTDFAPSIRPHDHRSMAAETEDEGEKYLLCSYGTVLGFSVLEKTKSKYQRTGRFFPSDDYFEFAEVFAEFPQAENDCFEANVREGYGLKDEDAPAFRKKFNDLCERIDGLKLYVADENGQQIPAAEIRLEDLSRFYRDESERWLHVDFGK